MTTVRWRGQTPGSPLARRLEALGLRRARGTDEAEVEIVRTRDGRRAPAAPRGAIWLWAADGPIALAAAREAVRRGAAGVVELAAAGGAELLARRVVEATAPEEEPPPTPGIVAESAAARRLLRQVWRAARTAMPVLLTGETGTGKEEMAGLLHRWSGRRGPYLPINCAAIPDELMESELFGHARGAFSGAIAAVDGKLLAAHGGTVFLDEIDDTPLALQAKLLRVVEEGVVTRVGETAPRPADFRLVAASNRDLRRLIARGEFGGDLYERLAIVRIELPRLADRREDVPALARHFLLRYAERAGVPASVTEIEPLALAALAEHPWPGNIRELRNVIYQALVAKRAGDTLVLADVERLLAGGRTEGGAGLVSRDELARAIASGRFNLRRERDRLEREALVVALARAGGVAARAARLLGEVGRGAGRDPGATVRGMMRRLGVAGEPAPDD